MRTISGKTDWYSGEYQMCNFWGDVPFATTPTSKDDMHNDPRTDKNIIYTRLIQDLINNEGEMQWNTMLSLPMKWMMRESLLFQYFCQSLGSSSLVLLM